MTDINPRDLIQRLADELDHLHCQYNVPNQSALIAEARDYLDQSVPEELTDEALLAIAAASIDPYQDSGIAIGEYEPETERAVEVYGSELIVFARAVLARWGHPSIDSKEPTDEELRRCFLTWWREEGSAVRPHPEHDHEEHARLVSEIAWVNGAYVARWGHVTQQGCTQLP